MTTHIKVAVVIQDPANPEMAFKNELIIRGDLVTMEPGRKRDAAMAITLQRVSEAFMTIYHAACAPKGES